MPKKPILPELAAYYYALDNPDVILTGLDGGHGNETRIYLKAYAMYSTIFRESTSGINFYGNLDIDSAKYIQQFASKIVINDLIRWNIELSAHFDPDIKQNAVILFKILHLMPLNITGILEMEKSHYPKIQFMLMKTKETI